MRAIRVRGTFLGGILGVLALALAAASPAGADETCNSPYMGNLIKGQEDYLYVWALGVKSMGDGGDKLVTIDVNPASSRYGKVIHKVSVRGRGEEFLVSTTVLKLSRAGRRYHISASANYLRVSDALG